MERNTIKVKSKKNTSDGFLKGIKKYKKAAIGALILIGAVMVLLTNGKKEIKFIPLGKAGNKGYNMLDSMVKKSMTGKSKVIDEYLIYERSINKNEDPFQSQEQSSGISHDRTREGLGYTYMKRSSRMPGAPVKFIKKK